MFKFIKLADEKSQRLSTKIFLLIYIINVYKQEKILIKT